MRDQASAEELRRACPWFASLPAAAPGLEYRAARSLAYGAGPGAWEVVSRKVADIDSGGMVIRVSSRARGPRIAT